MLEVLMIAALVAAQSSPPVPQKASTAVATEAEDSVGQTTASVLARTIAPADVMIPLEMGQARRAILALPSLDDDAKQLERDYPGLHEALWIAAEPELRKSVEADYPSFWAVLEKLYVSRLTEREAQALIAFYRSATGQKLLRTMYGNFDATKLLPGMVASDFQSVNADEVQAATDSARAKAVQQLGPEDEASLMTVIKFIDLEKFRALGAETQKLTLEWVNKPNPEAEERLAERMAEAMERYMADHPPGK
jgi:hypothetical protein